MHDTPFAATPFTRYRARAEKNWKIVLDSVRVLLFDQDLYAHLIYMSK